MGGGGGGVHGIKLYMQALVGRPSLRIYDGCMVHWVQGDIAG